MVRNKHYIKKQKNAAKKTHSSFMFELLWWIWFRKNNSKCLKKFKMTSLGPLGRRTLPNQSQACVWRCSSGIPVCTRVCKSWLVPELLHWRTTRELLPGNERMKTGWILLTLTHSDHASISCRPQVLGPSQRARARVVYKGREPPEGLQVGGTRVLFSQSRNCHHGNRKGIKNLHKCPADTCKDAQDR